MFWRQTAFSDNNYCKKSWKTGFLVCCNLQPQKSRQIEFRRKDDAHGRVTPPAKHCTTVSKASKHIFFLHFLRKKKDSGQLNKQGQEPNTLFWVPFHLKCEFWALGCVCHQRRAGTNIITLSSLIRYQLEVTSTSLELSYKLLLLSGT